MTRLSIPLSAKSGKHRKFNLCIGLILKCIWSAIWQLNSTHFPQRVKNDKNIYNWIIMTKNKRKKNRRILLQDIMSFIFTSYRIKIYFKIYLQKCCLKWKFKYYKQRKREQSEQCRNYCFKIKYIDRFFWLFFCVPCFILKFCHISKVKIWIATDRSVSPYLGKWLIL
jgi:hypothetical protein